MGKDLGIAVIHGMGDQKQPENGLGFSRRLHRNIRAEIGEHRFDRSVAWREIHWADVLQPRQDDYERDMKAREGFGLLRGFVMHRLSDAASYYPPNNGGCATTYRRIHARVEGALDALSQQVKPGAPLILLAHSLGGHILSNYIYDMRKADPDWSGGFASFESFRHLITFGCNIPVFVFACDQIVPIGFPGRGTRPEGGWWHNFYDGQDPLGYPLDLLQGYDALAAAGELHDHRVNVGLPPICWTPWSHNAYWSDRRFGRRLAEIVSGELGG